MMKTKLFTSKFFRVLSLLLVFGLGASCSSTKQVHADPQGFVRLLFSGKSTEIPYVKIAAGYNMIYDQRPGAQKDILDDTTKGLDDAMYDSFQTVPGSFLGFHSGRARTLIKYDVSQLNDPVSVTIMTDGVVTGTVTLRKSPIFNYQIIQY